MITHDTSLHRLTLPWLVSGLRVQPRGVRAAGAAGGGRHAHRHTGAAQGAQVHRPRQVEFALCICNVSYVWTMPGFVSGAGATAGSWQPASWRTEPPAGAAQTPKYVDIIIYLVFCSTSLVPSLNCAHVQAGAVRAGRGARDGLAALRHRIHREIHVRVQYTRTLPDN